MLKRILSAFGSGGPTVDTVLHTPVAMPGQVVAGRVAIQGGTDEAVIDQVALSLATQAAVWRDGRQAMSGVEFGRHVVRENVHVPAGGRVEVPFEIGLPWETPITAVGDAILPGMTVGLRTDLVIAGDQDEGDLDRVLVRPLPSQDRVLDAFGELGATFRSAGVEAGRVLDVPHTLPFFQEIRFSPPPALARLNKVELTFVATQDDLWVILEVDRRGGMFRPTADAFGRFHKTHAEAEDTHWPTLLEDWLTAD